MKKLMIICLSALAFSANAGIRELPKIGNLRTPIERQKPLKKVNPDFKPVQPHNMTRGENPGTRAGGLTYNLEGLWTFQLGDYYFDTSAIGPIFENFQATLDEENYVVFEPESNYIMPFIGWYYDVENLVVFEKILLGTTNVNGRKVYVFQQPYVYNYDLDEIEYFDDIQSLFYVDAGVIEFAADNGIAWLGYLDEEGTDFLGYFDIYDLESAREIIEENDDEDWTDIGDATFIDGWVIPGFYADQFQFPYQVPAQQNKENPNLYRLVGPYHHGPVAEVNQAQNTGYIKFDISDPEHVVFYQVDSGFSNFDLWQLRFYCYNQLGSYLMQAPEGVTLNSLIQQLGDEIPYTTFKDGVVKLSYKDIPSQDLRLYDANFGNQIKPLGGYMWTDVSMLASITLPSAGVDSLVSDEFGETQYYNLQGQKVINPEPGQILIKRQGKNSSKIVFK